MMTTTTTNTTKVDLSVLIPTDQIEAISDRMGYQTQMKNPAYEVTYDNSDPKQPIGDNGEPPTIANTTTRIEHIKKVFIRDAARPYMKEIMSYDIEKTIKAMRDEKMAQLETAIDAAII